MVLLLVLVVLAVGAFVMANRNAGSSVGAVFVLLTLVLVSAAIGLLFAIGPLRASQAGHVKHYTELVQVLDLVDAKEDAVLSSSVREAMATSIETMNYRIAEAKVLNDGLLDIWIRDELAAYEPLK